VLDLQGQIWCAPVVLLPPVELHRLEPEVGKTNLADISISKARRFGAALVLLCMSCQ
jgi:hypothetical protein